jgi:hypothetical protein
MSLALHPTPSLKDLVSIFKSPSGRVAQLHPQAPGSIFVTFYDSQGHSGGILTYHHTGISLNSVREISTL